MLDSDLKFTSTADFNSRMFADNSFPLLMGPCVIESRDIALRIAEEVFSIVEDVYTNNSDIAQGIVPVFKASFDKANRSSINGFRGPGLEDGLKILQEIKEQFGFALVSDVHETSQIDSCSQVLDIMQIPAFLCRQTDLIVAAAKSQKVLNIKKGQFLSPSEVPNIIKKANDAGNQHVFICERGNSFGYNNLVVDMRMFAQMQEFGIRTIFDATHSCQLPGAGGDKSLGNSAMAPVLARAAVAAGASGIFAETHFDPSVALSDGPNMIKTADLKKFILDTLKIRTV